MAGMYETENSGGSTGEALAPSAGSGVIDHGEELSVAEVTPAALSACCGPPLCGGSNFIEDEELALAGIALNSRFCNPPPCATPTCRCAGCRSGQDDELADMLAATSPFGRSESEELVDLKASAVSACTMPPCGRSGDEELAPAEAYPCWACGR